MKLKTATLLAIAGIVLKFIHDFIFILSSFGVIDYKNINYGILSLMELIYPLFILLFFIVLYKNQK